MSKSRSGVRPVFNRDLADRNAKLERENAALRELVEAVRETAAVPEPADYGEHGQAYADAVARAAHRIDIWLSDDSFRGPVAAWSASRIADRAGLFRAHLPMVTYPAAEGA